MAISNPVLIVLILVSVARGGVIYSPGYANVHYQGAVEHESGVDSADSKEEVTDPPEFCDELNPTVNPDTATEPYSENVNITKYHNQGPKKLHEAIELEEELDPTQQPDLEPTDQPVLEQQGIYYIYHPNGLLQKVVFNTKDDTSNMEYLAKFNYQNVEPIVEPVYYYDPKTLFFQRLQKYCQAIGHSGSRTVPFFVISKGHAINKEQFFLFGASCRGNGLVGGHRGFQKIKSILRKYIK